MMYRYVVTAEHKDEMERFIHKSKAKHSKTVLKRMLTRYPDADMIEVETYHQFLLRGGDPNLPTK